MGEGEGVGDLVSDGSPGRGDVEDDMGVDERVVFVVVVWEGAAGAGAGGGVTVGEEEASARAGGHESRAMCQLHTEGTQYGCGHYVIVRPPDSRQTPRSQPADKQVRQARLCQSLLHLLGRTSSQLPKLPKLQACEFPLLPPRPAQPTTQSTMGLT
jgi:hypothetical protein